jgi:hypothetical protein
MLQLIKNSPKTLAEKSNLKYFETCIVYILIGLLFSTIFSHGCHLSPHEDDELCADRYVQSLNKATKLNTDNQ